MAAGSSPKGSSKLARFAASGGIAALTVLSAGAIVLGVWLDNRPAEATTNPATSATASSSSAAPSSTPATPAAHGDDAAAPHPTGEHTVTVTETPEVQAAPVTETVTESVQVTQPPVTHTVTVQGPAQTVTETVQVTVEGGGNHGGGGGGGGLPFLPN